jgi:hypothetical protein
MALPGNLTTVEVTGRYIDASGAAVRGSVTFTLDTPLLDAGASTYIIETEYTVALDATGSFAVNLPATNDVDVTPTGWTWTLTPNFDGADPITFALPTNLTTVDITTLSPALPNPSTTYSYVLVSAVGAPSGVASLNSSGTIPVAQIGDASITAAKINSEAQVAGKALLADGTGGATWGDAGGGGGLDPFLLMGA